MVDITTNEYQRKWTTERIVLTTNDIWPDPLAEARVDEARKWIRRQGYHLRTHEGYAAIRLEKNSYTISEASTDIGKFLPNQLTPDCICYAAMLLYRRLKRDNVIA